MQYHSNTIDSSSEALILACSERVWAMARGFARSSDGRVDADEMYSVGMLEICEAVAAGRLAGADHPMAYLYGVARLAMCEEWRRVRGWSTVSLDAPLSDSDDTSFALLDVLPAPVPAAPAPVSTPVSRALNKALDRLPSARQRAVVRRRYGLPGYGACNLKETARALHTKVAAVDSAGRLGVRNLATDVLLCRAMGVEVKR